MDRYCHFQAPIKSCEYLDLTINHKDWPSVLAQGPLLLDVLLGAEMMSLLKIKNFLKSSFGVNVILVPKKRICSFISDLYCPKIYNCHSTY